MRINKLFHWLYFVLMSLPIFAIGTTCLYATFNENAYQSYSNEYVEQYNLVNSNNQIEANNTYQILYDETITANYSPVFTITDTNLYQILDIQDKIIQNFAIVNEQDYARLNITFTDNTIQRVDNWNDYSNTFYFTLKSTTFNVNYNMNRCKLYQLIFNTKKLDNVFYYAIDKVVESPLFTWAQDSFLGVPVSYLGGIFGLVSNSVINILLCYWVAISIIWLMFDVLMFVPMLIHKSIDKARF